MRGAILGVLLTGWAHAYAVLQTAEGVPVRWPEGPIRYAINGATPHHLDAAEAHAMVHAAFDAWAAATHDALAFEFVGAIDGPSTDFHPDRPELAHNVVHFLAPDDPLANDQLAFTVVRFDEATGVIVNAHIFINEALHEFGPDGPAYDVQSTLTHEVGHFLGLDHSPDEGAMMHSGLQRGASRELGRDDHHAARSLYGVETPPSVVTRLSLIHI